MILKIRSKLIIFGIFILGITLLAVLVGSTILNIRQTQRQNQKRLKTAILRAEHHIKEKVTNIQTTSEIYFKNTNLIYATNASVILEAYYHLIIRAGHDFVNFSADSEVDTLAFYSASNFQGNEILRCYYIVKPPPLQFTDPKSDKNAVFRFHLINPNKKNSQQASDNSPTFIIISEFNGQHLFHRISDGFYSPSIITDPNVFNNIYQPAPEYSLQLKGKELYLVSQLSFRNPVNSTFFKKDTHIGHFILEKNLNNDLLEMEKDLGLNIAVYTAQGVLGLSQITLPDLNDNATFSGNQLQTIEDKYGQKYDSLLIPLYIQNSIYGYLSVHISQAETLYQVVENIKLFFSNALIVIFLVVFLSFFLVKRFTKPIEELEAASKAIADGNLNVPIKVQGSAEMVSLAQRFTQMRDVIQEKIETQEKNLVIIEQKNEELRELDHLKDEFLANTSHELRTPLHGIVGIAEAMLASQATKRSQEEVRHISMIISNGHRLNNLINDLLEFYKMREFGIQLVKEPVFLHPLTNAVVAFCEPLINNQQIKLINQIDVNLSAVYADKSRLEQILYNLISAWPKTPCFRNPI
jgi:signal transduction histidine kinase